MHRLAQVKLFKVKGRIRKHLFKMPFTIEVRALNPKDAIEKTYSDLGSRHKAKRFEIEIEKIEEEPSSQGEGAAGYGAGR